MRVVLPSTEKSAREDAASLARPSEMTKALCEMLGPLRPCATEGPRDASLLKSGALVVPTRNAATMISMDASMLKSVDSVHADPAYLASSAAIDPFWNVPGDGSPQSIQIAPALPATMGCRRNGDEDESSRCFALRWSEKAAREDAASFGSHIGDG